MNDPIYLGDAVYATIKDGVMVLTTDSHVLADAGNVIVLEPQVLDALVQYAKKNQLIK